MAELDGITLIPAVEFSSGNVRGVVDYWDRKRATLQAPRTCWFEPLEIPRLLPHVMLKDVRRDPWDFRYRVVGTTVREHSRNNWTGKWMSEVPGQWPDSRVFRVMQWVAEKIQPAIFRPPYVGPHKEFKRCEAAVLPWTDADGLPDRILVAVDFLTD